MPRHTETIVIDAPGRDHGKTFVITEMDSWSALRFCAKAVLALAQNGSEISAGALAKASQAGPESIAAMGLHVFTMIPEPVALPLMDEIRACIAYQPADSRISSQPIRTDAMCQIEEPSTWAQLMRRAFSLHLGFLTAASTPTTG